MFFFFSLSLPLFREAENANHTVRISPNRWTRPAYPHALNRRPGPESLGLDGHVMRKVRNYTKPHILLLLLLYYFKEMRKRDLPFFKHDKLRIK